MATTQIKNGFAGGSDAQLLVNADGSINVNSSGGGGGSNASVGPTGTTAPTSATEIGGVTAGNLVAITATGQALDINLKTSSVTLPISAASLPLPAGASTSALQTSGNSSLSSVDSKTPALGQALAASSSPVVLTAAQLITLTPLTSVTVNQATGTNLHTVVDNFPATQPVSGTVSISGTVATLGVQPSSAAVTSVASSATVVTILASNASRRGAFIFNNSTAILYIKFGTAASLISFTLPMAANSYYEVPSAIYTGVITGIWAAANGNAAVTEVS